MGHELLNGRLRRIELFAPLEQLLLLVCETVVLLKRLLVDVSVLFERLKDGLEAFRDLTVLVTNHSDNASERM
jgi:hypothetical protein